jgi:acyl transferase domain-containing protein/NAD(P)-dependent dehydrogenase (short-subunit alcohol dehydrogenase family)
MSGGLVASNTARPVPVAIIGLGCLFPKADGPSRYWANIRDGIDAITEVPETHWRPDDYFDPDPKAADRTYARRGGFINPVDFAPLDFGLSPNTLEATDTTQLLGLVAARQAMIDAGYGPDRTFDRRRVSVLLGVTGTLELVIPLAARLGHPLWRKALQDSGVSEAKAEEVVRRIGDGYVGWQEDSFPGLLGNVVAGRIANRLDFGGTNCVVDAACASSLGAVHLAMLELASGRSDMVLTGGMDTFNDIFMYMCFSKTPALSPTGDARPFAAGGDGTILGEGLGCLVLKRLDDAERDGDRIYAVIKSVGSSSDGKGHAIYAPSSEGQVRALKEAYRLADVSPDTISLVEGHGTGTLAGDKAEAAALAEVYGESERQGSWCALGSVKSQIGHTKAAAGAAGLIKAALALHHKVLPPTIKVDRPIDALMPGESPFYINTERRPWLPSPEHPRRAAVSAFGFGGSNYHCVLEEYQPKPDEVDWDGDVQILAFSADTTADLDATLAAWPAGLGWDEVRRESAKGRAGFDVQKTHRVVLVAERRKADVDRLIASARAACAGPTGKPTTSPTDAIFVGSGEADGKLVLLFPGQGAQYPGMFLDLACRFPEMRDALVEANAAFAEDRTDVDGGHMDLSDYIYPRPSFDAVARRAAEADLRATEVAQPALGAVSLGSACILASFGVKPGAVAGHSYGELPSLCIAGRFDSETLHRLSRLRGRSMAEGEGDRGAMLAVLASGETIDAVLSEDGLALVVANKNSPKQSVLSGASVEIERARKAFSRRDIESVPLSVSAAFHSPFVEDARRRFSSALEEVDLHQGKIPVYANTTGLAYPDDPDQARDLLAGQLAEPVEFVSLVENMHGAGFRTFVEVGPGHRLTGLVRAILKGRAHAAFSVDGTGNSRGGVADLARALAHIAALGHEVDLTQWDRYAANQPAPAARKPTLTIPICGANYVKPKPPGITAAQGREKEAAAVPMSVMAAPANGRPAALAAVQNGTSTNGHSHPQPHAPATISLASKPTQVGQQSQPLPTSSPSASLPHHQGLIALQELGEQTAKLHRQFLEGQDRALQVLQSLLGQQPLPPLVVAPPAPTPPPTPAPPRPPSSPAILPQSQPTARPIARQVEPPTPVAPVAPTSGLAESTLLAVVAEKTGYPSEMLELSMEIEADLGIDSIKRVEIFSALQERLPDAPPIRAEHLGTLRTLRQVAEFLGGPSVSVAAKAAPEPGLAEATLLAVVSEKTGYPSEMLELSMEIEADLGIDSIKRVEIFSALQERLPDAPPIRAEHLGTLRTLRQVAEFLADVPVAPQANSPKKPVQASPVKTIAPAASITRCLVSPRRIDPTERRDDAPIRDGAEIWITADPSELATAIKERLDARGFLVRLVGFDEIHANSENKGVAGLVVLAPQAAARDDFLLDSFRLLQKAGPALRESGRSGGATFVTVSRLDGAFGMGGNSLDFDPVAGGLAGLSKTAGHEWPEVRCRAIDLDPGVTDVAVAAGLVVEELFRTGPSEIGLTRDGQFRLELSESSLEGSGSVRPLERGDVVVVTGGARGVTAEVAIGLARAYAPTLILLGRSPEPQPEPSWLHSLEDEAEIKRELLGRSGGRTTPREIEVEFRRIAANREAVRNLGRIAEAGGSVVYRQVDVRDNSAVSATLAEIQTRFGPIHGLVHGAGVLSDALIEAKSPESFDLVYGTKVEGLRALLAATNEAPLKLIVLFSSSTARFGRTGQVDYAIANEVLNKMALVESKRRPDCRVLSVNWGPWDGGMVTAPLKRIFAEEGVGLISPEAGANYLVRELAEAKPWPVEIVILGGADALKSIAPATQAKASTMSLVFERQLSTERMPILRSHVIDGRAVLPMAITLEWLAHAAILGQPGLHFQGIDGLRVHRGVFVEEIVTYPIRVYVGTPVRANGQVVIPTELRGGPLDREVVHSRAEVILGDRPATTIPSAHPVDLRPYRRGIDEIYDQILFHGTDLRGIVRVDGYSDSGIAASMVSAPAPKDWMTQPARGTWLADPLVLDSVFQLMIVWTSERYGAASLPCYLGTYRQYRRAFPKDGARVVARVVKDSPGLAVADIEILDTSGAVIATINGYECVIDASLNGAFRRNRPSR